MNENIVYKGIMIDKLNEYGNISFIYKTTKNINDKNPKYKIELNSGEYLSDIKDLFVNRN